MFSVLNSGLRGLGSSPCLSWILVLCSWARHFFLVLSQCLTPWPLAQVYYRVLVNVMPRGNPMMNYSSSILSLGQVERGVWPFLLPSLVKYLLFSTGGSPFSGFA